MSVIVIEGCRFPLFTLGFGSFFIRLILPDELRLQSDMKSKHPTSIITDEFEAPENTS
jgi:hypothetical protein